VPGLVVCWLSTARGDAHSRRVHEREVPTPLPYSVSGGGDIFPSWTKSSSARAIVVVW
jgi:hypothetical protein